MESESIHPPLFTLQNNGEQFNAAEKGEGEEEGKEQATRCLVGSGNAEAGGDRSCSPLFCNVNSGDEEVQKKKEKEKGNSWLPCVATMFGWWWKRRRPVVN